MLELLTEYGQFKGVNMKTTLEKTNEEMYDEAIRHFEIKATASGEFEQGNM